MDIDLPQVIAILQMTVRPPALISYLYSQLLLLADLRQYLFDLPDNKRTSLLSALSLRQLASGEFLFHKGDISDSLFILLTGVVGIYDGFGIHSPLIAQLPAGKVFGERGLVRKAPRLFSCLAMTDTLLICLDAGGFKALLEPAFHARTEEKLQFIDRYLPGGKNVLVTSKERLAFAFDMRYCHRGKRLATQNRLTPCLYFIVSGECVVLESHLGVSQNLVKLGPGSLFGDESVLLNRPSSYHIDVSTEGTWLYVISKEDALKFIPDIVLENMRKQCVLKAQNRSQMIEKLHNPSKSSRPQSTEALFRLANPAAKRRIVFAHRRSPSTQALSKAEGTWSTIKQDLCHYTPTWPVQESPFSKGEQSPMRNTTLPRDLDLGARSIKRLRASM